MKKVTNRNFCIQLVETGGTSTVWLSFKRYEYVNYLSLKGSMVAFIRYDTQTRTTEYFIK